MSGDIHLKVTYGDGSRKRKVRTQSERRDSKVVPADPKAESHSSSEVEVEAPSSPLAKSGQWRKNDSLLVKSAFVVIPEDGDRRGRRPQDEPTAEDKEEKEEKPPAPKEEVEAPVSPRSGVPRDAKGQLELIQRMIKETRGSCVADIAIDDLHNALVTLVNTKTGTTSKVTLMIPQNVGRGEFTLWTHDGAYELGRTGSILRAMNKVVESFARKNGVDSLPKFPEGQEGAEGRGMLLTSGWAAPRRDKVTREKSKGSDEEGGQGQGGYLEGDDDAEDAKLITEDVTASRTQFLKHVEEFRALHGASEIGLATSNKIDYTLRLALAPSVFLDPLMSEVWQIHWAQKIVIEMDVVSPYYLDAAKPPAVRCYQSDARNLGEASVAVASFGLQWYLQKRLETFLARNWPPRHTHLFLDLVSHAMDRIMACADNCIICDKKLVFSMLKPSICDEALCQFSHEQFGLGVDPASEIAANPDVVDILITATMAAAIQGDGKRFLPFPAHLEVKWKDAQGKEVARRFQASPVGDPTSSDLQQVRQIIEKLPSVAEMARWRTTQELKMELDKRDHMAFPLLRWILTSNRAHLSKLKPSETISAMNSTRHQYLLLSTPPAKERKFQEEKKRHGSFWAFHGSGFGNWHSILRNGLKNLSGTALMSTGAVYGNGIYMAADSNTSMSYAKAGSGWERSIFNEAGNSNLQILALCEVINAGYKANPYYVVANEDHVVTRYLFLFNNKNTHKNVLSASITLPQIEYLKLQKPNNF